MNISVRRVSPPIAVRFMKSSSEVNAPFVFLSSTRSVKGSHHRLDKTEAQIDILTVQNGFLPAVVHTRDENLTPGAPCLVDVDFGPVETAPVVDGADHELDAVVGFQV